MTKPIHVIGGGLAGSEAAWQIASAGVPVVLHEMRPGRGTEAHKTGGLAELVCSNSFRSDDAEANAVGLLHAGDAARSARSSCARATRHQVPAGGALAVDRDGFSDAVTAALAAHPLVAIERGEVAGLPPADWDSVIVATGPLTSPALAEAIGGAHRRDRARLLRRHRADRLPRDDRHGRRLVPVALRQGRTGRHRRRLHQLPARPARVRSLRRRAARRRQDELQGVGSDDALFRRLPADRGDGRARPRDAAARADEAGRADQPAPPGEKPYAVVQLRQDNALGTLFNMVGFQTKLKHGEQARIFRMIPGLEKRRVRAARRAAPQHLPQLAEAAGLDAAAEGAAAPCASPARSPAARAMSRAPPSASWPGASRQPSGSAGRSAPLPATTALGALIGHITGGHIEAIEPGAPGRAPSSP